MSIPTKRIMDITNMTFNIKQIFFKLEKNGKKKRKFNLLLIYSVLAYKTSTLSAILIIQILTSSISPLKF